MSKRLFWALALVFFVSALAAGQQVKRTKPGHLARPRAGAAVTVIDLRNAALNKKPPKREAEPTYSLRMKTGARANATALNAVQLSEALKGAGINVPSPNVYARLSAGQLSVPGKASMYLVIPSMVYPDRVEFIPYFGGLGQPTVVLEESGTFVLDFLVEVEGSQTGLEYEWGVVWGGGMTCQTQMGLPQGGPQHVLVVASQEAFASYGANGEMTIGLYCTKPGQTNPVGWTLYLVDITKL